MSKNFNRAKLSKAYNNQEYRKLYSRWLYPPYWDEGYYLYPRYNRGTKKDNKKFWRKQKMSFEMRMYRTWKHQRKTQWRE